jgi:hypothetical protein
MANDYFDNKAIRIKFNKEKGLLYATLADGTMIPGITEIRVKSVVGEHIVKAEIIVIANLDGLEEIDFRTITAISKIN